jgi:regulatory subunit for Cdc7p protein kinase
LLIRSFQHIKSRKHRKFAQDDSNFLQLDFLLGRVRRRTVQEVEGEKSEWEEKRDYTDSHSDSGEDDDADASRFLSQSPQGMDETIRPWDNDVDIVGMDRETPVDLDA